MFTYCKTYQIIFRAAGLKLVRSADWCKRAAANCVFLTLLFVHSPAFAYFLVFEYDLRGLGRPCGAFASCDVQTEMDGVFIGTDKVTWFWSLQATTQPLGGIAYFDGEMVNNIPDGNLLITTIYGFDLEPTSSLLTLTGFDPSNPELVPISNETIFSSFGTAYTSSFQDAVQLSEIGAYLPGADLSPFAEGDPNSLLYLFQTQVPANEFVSAQLIPEPTTGTLLAVGLLSGLAILRFRIRNRKAG